MPEKLTWMFTARVAGGPSLTQSGDLDVDGYVKLAVTIPNGEHAVEVLPGDGGPAQVVVISAETPGANVDYKVGNDFRPLDGPLVLIGTSASRLLGDKIGTLTFKNEDAADAVVSILVGRDATP